MSKWIISDSPDLALTGFASSVHKSERHGHF
jgi:hypothetical protein